MIKFTLPEEGKSTTINVIDCAGGAEVLERALRKFGKLNPKPGDDTSMSVEIVNGGLSVEGWGAFLDWGQEESSGLYSLLFRHANSEIVIQAVLFLRDSCCPFVMLHRTSQLANMD